MKFTVLTLFPDIISSYLEHSIMGAAQHNGLFTTNTVQIRDFATDTHKTVDDTPYGGGAGMVMKVEPIHAALSAHNMDKPGTPNRTTIVLAARGRQFTQQDAVRLAQSNSEIALICGRYEGIDQRVSDHLADEEFSIGPYVLAGGELAALVVIEAIARNIPGVLGNPDSLAEESHSSTANPEANGNREYPQYTKPASYNGWDVPDVLLSGNHEAIQEWRHKQQQ